mgnify:CR=1 FL=1
MTPSTSAISTTTPASGVIRSGGSAASAISERIRKAFSATKQREGGEKKRRMTIGGMGLADVSYIGRKSMAKDADLTFTFV